MMISSPELAHTRLPVPLAHIHFAYTTRRVNHADIAGLVMHDHAPEIGQIVLARVVQIGQHKQIELPGGRKARLYLGDYVALVFGNRYAPDQFEAVLPKDMDYCQMVAGGGLAAQEIARNAAMAPATIIQPVGLLANAAGKALTLRDYALRDLPVPERNTRPAVYVVCGTSMNAGKTHTAHEMVRGLRAMGLTVGAAKVTGTGAGNDPWRLRDCGADPVLDFTDAGYPSTYLLPLSTIEHITESLLTHIAASGVDAIVVEIADGIGQAETAALLQSPCLRDWCDAVVFAAADPIAAKAGVAWLRAHHLPIVAASGLMTAEPQIHLEASELLDVPVLGASQLAEGEPFLAALRGSGTRLPLARPQLAA